MVEPRNFGYYMIDDIVSYYAWVMKFEIRNKGASPPHSAHTRDL